MPHSPSARRTAASAIALVAAGATGIVVSARADKRVAAGKPAALDIPLVTGKRLSPLGTQTPVGHYPNNLVVSPDGRWVVSSSLGSRSYLTVLDARTGRFVSRLGYNAPRTDQKAARPDPQGLYYGLAFDPTPDPDGRYTLYAARGSEDRIAVLRLDTRGSLAELGKAIETPSGAAPGADPLYPSGLALSPDGKTLYAANNTADPKNGMRSTVSVVDTAARTVRAKVDVPGYPYAVLAPAVGPGAGKVYVGSEQRPVVCVLDAATNKVVKEIATGSHPVGLTLDKAGRRLFVANADSDTISVVDTATDTVSATLLLRPAEARGLPGATPNDVALSPDEKTLYVTLADMNAVAVVDLEKFALAGYLPTGWYPTAVAVSPDGARLFVANAKGVSVRNPNGEPAAVAAASSVDPRYVQAIIEGTVSTVDLLSARRELASHTRRVLDTNRVYAGMPEDAARALKNPGIEHVIYVVKENRTYDQVLSDLSRGNRDPGLLMFGREITPNQHALAERFVLLDNFYCAAEVSGDGWNWSTAGMANEYTSRTVPYSYTGKKRPYDWEGTNHGVPVDRQNIPDVATPPAGYIWDQAIAANVSLRNYGFFADDLEEPRENPEEGAAGVKETQVTKRALENRTDLDYRPYDLNYPDSDGWSRRSIAPFPGQMTTFGKNGSASRFAEWRREFDGYVKNGNLPRFQLVRFGNDHTQGTRANVPAPRAYVADNDYAVGQLVEAVSRSPYWRKTAIFILEDDAQNGNDHVDAHRSIAFVISPFVKRSSLDSRFYNTDSVLHTMSCLLDLPPLNQYVAIAPTMGVFGAKPDNAEPYTAILPARSVLAERNPPNAYGARQSASLFPRLEADGHKDAAMNDILWRAVKGPNVPMPPPRYSGPLGVARRVEAEDED